MRLQEKINQALEWEHQQAVVAEVTPASDGDLAHSEAHRFGTRRRHWFVIGAVLLIVAAVTTTLVWVFWPKPQPEQTSKCG
jgi:ferric-dicitrate binding protein FerR (iron transport regulator)